MKLKGKTIIELTDINTGQVTTHKDENFITNALSDICQPITKKQETLNTTVFVTEKACTTEALMRGLFLFDSVLPNDASKYFPDKGVKMVGHASDITYTGSDLTFGSYNVNQSNISSNNERTYVWDFTSEQANGTINSVCLTTQAGGYIGYGSEDIFDNASTSRPYTNITRAAFYNEGATSVSRDKRFPLYLSFAGDYLIEVDLTTLGTNTLTFYKTKLSSNEIDIFSKFVSYDAFAVEDKSYVHIGGDYTETTTIDVDITTLGAGNYFGIALDGKHLYITQKQTSSESNITNAWASNTSISILRIDLETFATSTYTVMNTTGVALGIRTVYDRVSLGGYTFGVSNGYLFVRSWESATGANKCRLYAINLDDNTDVRQVTTKSGTTELVGIDSLATATPFAMSHQGNVIFSRTTSGAYSISSTSLMSCVDTSTFIMKAYCTTLSSFRSMGSLTYSSSTRPFSCDNPLYHVVENRGSNTLGDSKIFVSVVPNVLMTINNLSSPVEKTPAQTMRIIYKITKAE